jgi:gluconolactonase
MHKLLTSAMLLGSLGLGVVAAQQRPAPGIVKLDAGLDAVVAADAKVETLREGFGFINGSFWVNEGRGGHLLLSDIPANVIYRWTPEGQLSPFLEKPDWTAVTEARPPDVRFGANGLAFDREGRLVYCAEADRAIVRVEKDGKRTVLADRFEGKRLNSPNDLVFASNGDLYFTDPSGGGRFGNWDLKKELPFQGVFLLRNGKLQALIRDLERPNGIALSPDGRSLFVNDSVKRVIMRYDVQADGTVSNGRQFVDMNVEKAPGNPDGMKFDTAGNLYSIGPGGIWIISPAGVRLGTIVPPENAPGFTFGDPDNRAVYIAASTRLARVRVNIAGAR